MRYFASRNHGDILHSNINYCSFIIIIVTLSLYISYNVPQNISYGYGFHIILARKMQPVCFQIYLLMNKYFFRS